MSEDKNEMLIADSGSTKTEWRYIDKGRNISQLFSAGFNPYFCDEKYIETEIREKLIPFLPEFTQNIKVFYYGAGCSSKDKSAIVDHALKVCFPGASVEVNHDLLGAARSLCGHSKGIAAILGTGSNSCYYDGKYIVENIPSLGYILGDEGSGGHIGKTFIRAYLNQELPVDIADRFKERFKLEKDDILDAVYKRPMPNRFLASFAKFVFQNIKDPYCIELAKGCFNDFFDKHICKYEQYKNTKLSCTGSVAFYFSDMIKSIAIEKGVVVDKITETPAAGLVLYHLGEV